MTDINPDRLYDRNFLLAMASQTCFVIANTLMAHYSRWIEFLGGDLRQVGSIMGLGAFLGLLLRPWLAQWINRLGARAMWAVGYAVFAASSIANLMLVDIGPMIYILRSSLFVGTAIVFTSGLTYISQTSPDHRRVEAIGIFGIGGFLGMLIGPFLGDLFLYERARANFAALFLVAALANILPAIGLYFLRPTDSEGTNSSLRLADFLQVTRRHWPGMILLVDLTFGVCMSGPFIFVASFVDRASLAINGVSVIGLFFLCYAGMGIAVRLSSRRLPDRIGARKVLLVGMLFMAAGMLCFALVSAPHSWMIVVPALLGGIGHGLMFHTMTSLTLEAFPKAVRGTGSALALMMLDAGTLTGAPLLGWVGERFGFAALFGSIGALCLVTAAAYGATSRRIALLALITLLGLSHDGSAEAQMLTNWPQCRGPNGTGTAAPAARPPVRWSDSENVPWKTTLPGRGHSTPVIWGDRNRSSIANSSCAVTDTCFASPRIDRRVVRSARRRSIPRVCYADD